MIGRLTRYGLPFSNVVNDGTATNQITSGRTIENLRLKLEGTLLTKAQVSRYKLKANGAVIIDVTGSELFSINAYRGANQTDAKFLDLYFTDYSLNNEFDRMVGAFDTSAGSANITTEITLAGATAPKITPILMESAAQKSKGGDYAQYAPLISKILPYPFNVSTGGRLPINLPFGPNRGSLIKRIHIFHGGNLTGVVLKENSLVIHESLKDENEYEQRTKGRVPQTNVYTIDFVVDGDVKKAFGTMDSKSVELLCDFSAADVGNVLVEYLDPIGNL